MLDKFGGDSMAETLDNLARYASPDRRPARGRPRRRRRLTDESRPTEARPAPAATTERRPMDVVLVGLPGSGKSAVGRRLGPRHDATFVDLDEAIETRPASRIPDIFATEGEAGIPGPRADGHRGARAGRSRPERPTGHRHRRRGGRRPAEPLAALPGPARDLAR